MKSLSTEILVIGGGSTGVGIYRDAALRGFKTILVERSDLATGTTGRYHGLLHSGARYVVKDPTSAKECIAENKILRRIAADCIEDCGGFFVTTPFDDPLYADEFIKACQACGVPCEEIPVSTVLKEEPKLNPKISRAFRVPDAAIDSWKTCWANARDAEAHGGQTLVYHKVKSILKDDDTVKGAVVVHTRTGEETTIHADYTVNASGAWAGQIAEMAGVPITVLGGKGIMIAMNHRLTQAVINRCKRPDDGDILVPIRTVCVIGTTDVRVANPDEWDIEQWEIDLMMEEGEKLIPGFKQARALRVWGGVRPLYQADPSVSETRDVTRAYTLLKHNVGRFITMTGGKFTTYRQMAEVTMDAVCQDLGTQRKCTTADQAMPDSEDGKHYWIGSRLAAREEELHDDQLICECEMITRRRLEEAFRQRESVDLDDIRRSVRLGMGPCQGGFCIYRATGILHALTPLSPNPSPNGGGGLSAPLEISSKETFPPSPLGRRARDEGARGAANASLLRFLQERWKGSRPILWGDQLRQARLDDWIFQGLLDVEHLPKADDGR